MYSTRKNDADIYIIIQKPHAMKNISNQHTHIESIDMDFVGSANLNQAEIYWTRKETYDLRQTILNETCNAVYIRRTERSIGERGAGRELRKTIATRRII
jgi:hypothetical protein